MSRYSDSEAVRLCRKRSKEEERKANREAMDLLNEARAAIGLGRAQVPRRYFVGKEDGGKK